MEHSVAKAPSYDSSRQAYSLSVDPSSSQGYSDSAPRAGSFWSFTSNANGYPANTPTNGNPARPQVPSATPYDTTSVSIFPVAGVASSSDVVNGADPNDMAIRFAGDTNGCLKVSTMTTTDSCIFDPTTCAIANSNNNTGMSLSFWVNLPNSFDTTKHYIIDTGGSEFGVKGISVYYTNSLDGLSFNQQLYVIVSTGTSYWKTVVNGLLIPYQWNNVGIRWSSSSASDGNPLGLQVFVNKTSVAWKRLPTVAGPPQPTSNNSATNLLTIGCYNDGNQAMVGRLDDLAFWYWRLMDNNSNGGSLGEIEYFDGDLQFSDTPSFCFGPATCLPGVSVIPPAPATAQVVVKNPYQQVLPNMEDTTLAVDGDCMIGDPSTWHGPHPIDCADTRHEMQSAVILSANYRMDMTVYDLCFKIGYSPNFNATQFLKSLVRVVQKAGPTGLIVDDLNWLLDTVNQTGLSKLQQDLSRLPAGNIMWVETYMDMVYVTSKLSEQNIYESLWTNLESNQNLPGLTEWNLISRTWLMMVVQALPNDASLALRSANNTAMSAIRYSPDYMPLVIQYPDYSNESGYAYQQMFWALRSLTWSTVTDYLLIPPTILEALIGPTNATVNLLANIYNSYGGNLPAYLDSRISGTDIGKLFFYVNSRIISLFAFGNQGVMLSTKEPFQFIVQHNTIQDERPFMKGSVLCVSWNYNDDQNKIGAWDTAGCKLNATNDTHSVCNCNTFGDFAVLLEARVPPDSISRNLYFVCLALYFVSIFCLTLLIMVVVGIRQLHYEIHIINLNVALSMMVSLIFYLFTWVVNFDQTSCIIVSVFMHYSYMSTYLWIALSAHYVFRAITSGLLGKIHNYFYVGYGVPAVVVCICLGANVLMYGFGMRCLGTPYHHFMAVYIGTFLFFAVIILPMLFIALCNIGRNRVKDVQDWSDVKHVMFGIIALWPFIVFVWVMAIFVYLVPQRYQIFDFMFELINSLQGLLVLLFLGVLIPSFRKGLLCKYKSDDGKEKKRKWAIPYLN